MFWKISWRNFKRKPLRSFLTLLGIAVGVASLLAVVSGVTTTDRLINEQVQESFGSTDFMVKSIEEVFPEQVLREVEGVSGVENALGLIHQPARIRVPGQEEASLAAKSVRLTGLSKVDTSLVPLKVIKGNSDASGLFLSQTTARLWGVEPGDSVSLEIGGKEHAVPVAAVVRDTMFLESPVSWNEAEGRNWRAALPIDVLEKLSGKSGSLQEVRIQMVESSNPKNIQKLEDRMGQKGYPVYTETAVVDPRQKNRMDELYLFLLVLGGTALLISCIILFQTFYTNITEREREFATMKSFGSTPDQIRGIVLREALIFSSVGTLLGILPGIWMAVTLQKGIFSAFHVDFDYQLRLGTALLVAVLLGISLPVIASLLPVKRASRISVTAVLQNQGRDPLSKLPKWRILVGGALLAVSLFDHALSYFPAILGAFFLIPFAFRGIQCLMSMLFRNRAESEVALRNALRQGRRHSNMAAVLMLGIALSLLMFSAFNYQDHYLERDRAVTFGGHLQLRSESSFKEKDLNALREKDGIQDATQVEEASVIWRSGKGMRRMNVLGVDPEWQQSHPLFTLQMGERKVPDLDATGTILLGDYAFQQWGGKVGETIRLQTPRGKEKFRVTGVVRTGFDSSYVGFVGRDRMKEEFGVKKAVRGLVALQEKHDQKKVKESLHRDMGDRLMEVRTLDEEVRWQRRSFPGLSLLFTGLLAVALGTVGIGIVNLLLMSVTERLPEYKIMRAVGASRFQVYGMVIGEGAVIGVTGVLVGSALGVWLIGLNAMSDLVEMEFSIPWAEWMITCVCGAIVTFVASCIPAVRAGNVSLPPVSLD